MKILSTYDLGKWLKDPIVQAIVKSRARLAGVITRDYLNKRYPKGFNLKAKKNETKPD